jgi:hypothetical protein
MKKFSFILFIVVLNTIFAFNGFSQEQKYKYHWIGILGFQNNYMPGGCGSPSKFEIKSFSFFNNTLKIHGYILDEASNEPNIDFIIVKAVDDIENSKLIIKDTIYKSMIEFYKHSTFRKIDAVNGEFRIKTKLKKDENIYFITQGAFTNEIEIIRKNKN